MNHDPALSTKQQIFAAVQSNTQHQYALEKYSQRLAAELQEIDKLLVCYLLFSSKIFYIFPNCT